MTDKVCLLVSEIGEGGGNLDSLLRLIVLSKYYDFQRKLREHKLLSHDSFMIFTESRGKRTIFIAMNKRLVILTTLLLASLAVFLTFKMSKTKNVVPNLGKQGVQTYSEPKHAKVLVQDGSYYGPPYDREMYQLEIDKSHHLFAKSGGVDLSKYLGKSVTVSYREVQGVIMGEQQFVLVDSVTDD